MRSRRTSFAPALAGGLAIASVLATERARAGGFEFPDNGTEALGRGAAFTAKADDPTAVLYNVAGLARQRGTKVLVDGNITFASYTFQRSGTYPDNPADPKTPWGGQPFPLVKDTSSPFFAPFLAATTDLGFDRLTLALAAFGPSGVGVHTYPLGVEGTPSPARYDLVQAKTTIIYPTLAAAYRVLPWLDVGIGLSLAVGNFNLTTISYADSDKAPMLCKNAEYQPCDAQNNLQTKGTSFAPSFGVMVRPYEWLSLGANFRTGYTIDSTGTAKAQLPPALQALSMTPFDPAAAEFITSIPWVLRLGGRYITMEKGREKWDAELDFTFEGWGGAQGEGPLVKIPKLGSGMFEQDDIHPTVQHHMNNTFSIRAGGAYNMDAGDGDTLTLRGGLFYDASSTDSAYTRVDFDTLSKVGLTLGAGYRMGPFQGNVALAEIFDISRDVTDGAYAPINGTQHGDSVTHDGMTPLPPTNNGNYSGHIHVLSLGVTVQLDTLLGFDHKPEYLNAYEDPEGKTPAGDKKEGDKEGEEKKEGDSLDKALNAESKDDGKSPIEHSEDRPQKPAQQDAAAAQTGDAAPATEAAPAPPPPKKKPRKKKPKPQQRPRNDVEL